MKRSPQLQAFLDYTQNRLFGRTAADGVCVTCGSDKVRPEDFRDDESRKEFAISTMCQECQDDIFGDE